MLNDFMRLGVEREGGIMTQGVTSNRGEIGFHGGEYWMSPKAVKSIQDEIAELRAKVDTSLCDTKEGET